MIRDFEAADGTGDGFRRVAVLIGFLALTLGVGVLSGLVTEPSVITWYPKLAKPSFNPPNWVFAPVWTVLYILMGIAGWRVWCITDFQSRALLLWIAQLVLNFAWSMIFFGAHAIGAAFVEIVVLWSAVLLTTIAFFRIERAAGLLLLLYFGWVSFAAILNLSVWRLNPI